MKNKTKKKIRLPNHITPIKYKLEIKPDMDAFVFSGKETINIKIDKPTKKIIIHSKDLDIETVKITSSKKKVVSNKGDQEEKFTNKISYNTEEETAIFEFKKEIKKGIYDLHIIFSGIISDTLRGFYKSRYEENGKEKFIATTQFEATDARRAFPSFDEPAQKATFEVSFIIKDNYEAISNTLPIHIEKHESGFKTIHFAESPKMSTYLLAFIIGEFEYIEGKIYKNSTSMNKFSGPRTREDEGPDHENLFTDSEFIKVRVFTTKGKKHQAKFALDVAIKAVEFYNEYFDIPYPLPTLDLIAIPDFESAAMENWGAITFRETALLVDEEHTSLSNKQWIAIVIAHEIAHQWFGNLVTMHWWTDLWLNEGFASYMENLCIDKLFPHWNIWNLYIADRYSLALNLDSLENSHPIEVEVHHPNEINEIFDMVSYAKGSAVIRMLANYLGEDKFRDGLRHYLKKHSYNNTKTIDLWKSFEKVSMKPILKMMNSWTKQTGYPLISVSNTKNNKIKLEQERFFSSRNSKKLNSKKKNIWQVPVELKDGKILLAKKELIINKNPQKVNKNEGSFIRTRYDKETLELIKKNIEDGKLSTIDRLGIIRDLFALAEGGYIKTDTALEFSLAYKNEDEYIVWSEMSLGIDRVFSTIIKTLNDKILEEKYKKYALSLFVTLLEKVGWEPKENENHSMVFLRSLALSHALSYGDKKSIKKAEEIFEHRLKDPIRADIRSSIYGSIARNGKIPQFKLFKIMYKEEKMHEEKDRIAQALASFRDEKILEETLKFALSEEVKDQDAPFIIARVWSNPNGRDVTWKFVKKNWAIILKKYGEGGHFLSRLISPLKTHTSVEDLKDIKKFFKNNVAPGSERTLLQAYEKIESNIAWIKDDKKDIINWLDKNY